MKRPLSSSQLNVIGRKGSSATEEQLLAAINNNGTVPHKASLIKAGSLCNQTSRPFQIEDEESSSEEDFENKPHLAERQSLLLLDEQPSPLRSRSGSHGSLVEVSLFPQGTLPPPIRKTAHPSRLDILDVSPYRPGNSKKVYLETKGKGLGISLAECINDSLLPGVFITHIKPGTPASACKSLQVGDFLLSINGVSLVGIPYSSIIAKIKAETKKKVTELEVISQRANYEYEIIKASSDQKVGISLVGIWIADIVPHSLAERAGLKADHCLLSVNGTSVVDMPIERIIKLLDGSDRLKLVTMPAHLYAGIVGKVATKST